MSIEVKYRNNVVASIEVGQTAILKTKDCMMPSDIVIACGSAGIIMYNGTKTTVAANQTATIACAGNVMLTDVVVVAKQKYVGKAGLYDADNNRLSSWDKLVTTYGMDIEKDYGEFDYNTDPSSPYSILLNNSELSTGTQLVIPNTVARIGAFALNHCSNLISITIPNSVTHIESFALSDCTNLTGVIIPDSIVSIGIGAFHNCASLTDVFYTESEEQWEAITISESNEPLMNATITYNCYADVTPEDCLMFSSPGFFAVKPDNTAYRNGTIEYSTNRVTWKTWDEKSPISSNIIGRLYLRGVGSTSITGIPYAGGSSQGSWILSGENISCKGNIENLLDYKTVARGEHPTMDSYCYSNMFLDCDNLICAPELPAATLTNSCYEAMFRGCSQLKTVPELTVTALAPYCCNGMFSGCDNIHGVLDFTNVVSATGLENISHSYDLVLRFGTTLKSIESANVFGTVYNYGNHRVSIRYEFTDNDTPEFNTSYVVSKGESKATASYKIYTDNTAIKDGALSQVDEYTTVFVYHLNGEVWE